MTVDERILELRQELSRSIFCIAAIAESARRILPSELLASSTETSCAGCQEPVLAQTSTLMVSSHIAATRRQALHIVCVNCLANIYRP